MKSNLKLRLLFIVLLGNASILLAMNASSVQTTEIKDICQQDAGVPFKSAKASRYIYNRKFYRRRCLIGFARYRL